MQEQLELNPALSSVRNDIQEFTERWIEDNQENNERVVYTIPVVVHVIYESSSENISDAQIISQIDVLNEDYRRQNSDLAYVPSVWNNLIADCEIQFALAVRTPNGYETNGITRTQTTVTNWNGSDDVKYTSLGGHDAWPNTEYLNIWVCNIGSGLLGFAYQPGINADLDGLVIGYRFFGTEGNVSSSYNLGRTATHEIGHYFNLDHPWGPGASNSNCSASDNVSDTPVQEDANYGCETFPHVSCGNGPNGDMFNNFMDYGDDDCVIFFTEGQKARMLAALNGPRAALKTSNGLTPHDVGIDHHQLAGSLLVYPNPSNNVIHIQLDQGMGVRSDIKMLNLLGELIMEETNVNLDFAAHRLDVSELPAGVYILEISTDKERISRKINIIE